MVRVMSEHGTSMVVLLRRCCVRRREGTPDLLAESVVADWLEEHGWPDEAEKLRSCLPTAHTEEPSPDDAVRLEALLSLPWVADMAGYVPKLAFHVRRLEELEKEVKWLRVRVGTLENRREAQEAQGIAPAWDLPLPVEDEGQPEGRTFGDFQKRRRSRTSGGGGT